jgi:hypothetical protein
MTEFEQKVLTDLAGIAQSAADGGMLTVEAQAKIVSGIALLIEGKAQILDKLAGIAQGIKEQNELFAEVVGGEIANLNRRLDNIRDRT